MQTNHPQMPLGQQLVVFGKLLIIWIAAAIIQAL